MSNFNCLKMMLCIWEEQKCMLHCELLKIGENIPPEFHRLQIICLSAENNKNDSNIGPHTNYYFLR